MRMSPATGSSMSLRHGIRRLSLWTSSRPGKPPVYIGFGSMGFGKHARTRGQIVVGAVEKAGVRAVVATGWGGLEVGSLPDGVHVVEAVPHAWLFPRTVGVVHHGGAGTTAAGLLAARPTLVCPVLGDQGFWAQRVQAIWAWVPHRCRCVD